MKTIRNDDELADAVRAFNELQADEANEETARERRELEAAIQQYQQNNQGEMQKGTPPQEQPK